MLVKFTILHGKLTELVNEAQSPKGEKGSQIDNLFEIHVWQLR